MYCRSYYSVAIKTCLWCCCVGRRLSSGRQTTLGVILSVAHAFTNKKNFALRLLYICPSSLLYLCQMFLPQYVLGGVFFQPHVTVSNRSADVLLRLTCDAVNGEPPTRGADIIHASYVLDTNTCTLGVPLCSFSAAAQSCLSCISRAVHYTTVGHQGRSVQNLLTY